MKIIGKIIHFDLGQNHRFEQSHTFNSSQFTLRYENLRFYTTITEWAKFYTVSMGIKNQLWNQTTQKKKKKKRKNQKTE